MSHPGPPIASMRDVHLSFSGVSAIKGVSFEVLPGELFAIIGPNGAGKTSLFNVLSGVYRPQRGSVEFLGESILGVRPHQIAARGLARTFQNIALFSHLTVLDNLMLGRHQHIHYGFPAAFLWRGRARSAGARAPRRRGGDRRLPRAPGVAHPARGAAAVRRAEAGRARPGPRHGAQAAPAGRAGGRHEPRGDRGHRPLHPRHPRRARRVHRHGRARHGPGDGPRGPGHGGRLRHPDHHRDSRRRRSGTPTWCVPTSARRSDRDEPRHPDPGARETDAAVGGPARQGHGHLAGVDLGDVLGGHRAGRARAPRPGRGSRRPGRHPLREPPRVADRRHGSAGRQGRLGGHLPDQPGRGGRLPARRLRGPDPGRRGPGAGGQGVVGPGRVPRSRTDRLSGAAGHPASLRPREAAVLAGVPRPGPRAPRAAIPTHWRRCSPDSARTTWPR